MFDFEFDEQLLLHEFEALFTSPQDYFTKTFVNRCLTVSKHCLEAAQRHPQLILALLNSKQVDLSCSPICLRSTLFLSVTVRRDKFNDHFAQHLIASCICTFVVMHARSDNDNKPELKQLIRYYQSLGLSIWKETLRIAQLLTRCRALRHLPSPKLSFRQQYLLAASAVARLLPQSEMLSIFRTLTSVASPALIDAIQNWAQFPGIWLPGRVVNIGTDTAVIMCKEQHKVGYLPLVEHSDVIKWASIDDLSLLKTPQSVDFKKIKQWTDDLGLKQKSTNWPFAPSFAVNHPPSALLRIIDLLNSTDTDITLLSEQIEQERMFAQFLTTSASADNRMNLPVHDVKQAVLTYGIDRVGDMLVQRALTQRLTQKVFPISPLCQRLLALSSDIAAHISFETESTITPEHASLLVSFAIAPIFSITGLKIALNWRPSATHLYSIDSLVPASETDFRSRAVQLMRGWHQHRDIQAAVQSSNKLPAQCHKQIRQQVCILGLSLSLARQWLWHVEHFCSETHEFESQAKRELGIDDEWIGKLQHQLSAHIWLPIDL